MEQLQAVKGDILTQQKESEKLALTTQQLEQATLEKEQLTTNITHISKDKASTEKDLAAAKNTYDTAKPAIAKAKELDIRLTQQRNVLHLSTCPHFGILRRQNLKNFGLGSQSVDK